LSPKLVESARLYVHTLRNTQ